MLNDEQYRLQIKSPHFSSANNGPQMITFQMVPDILPPRVHVTIYLWFDSDSSALQHIMFCCWIWQCTVASVCLNNECLLINDDQNSGCQYSFNNIALVLRFSCQVWPLLVHVHVTTSPVVGVAKHTSSQMESYLTVILRHCVRRDPNNQIRLLSPIYSPAMLIKMASISTWI